MARLWLLTAALVAFSAAETQTQNTGLGGRTPGGAVVSGRITDDVGDPMVRVYVQLLARVVNAGHTQFTPGPAAVTNDLGVYRIALVAPGTYIVAVAAARQDRSSDAAGYPTMFHPDVVSPGAATVLTLGLGDDRSNVNLRFTPLSSLHISGKVTGLDRRRPQGAGANGGPPVELRLLAADAPNTPAGFEVADTWTAGGQFTFAGIPPGRYVIRLVDFPAGRPGTGLQTARLVYLPSSVAAPPPMPTPNTPTLWAEVPVNLEARSLDDVPVAAAVAARVSGTVIFEGTAEKPPAGRLATTPIVLQPADGRDYGQSPVAWIEPDGRFTTVGMPPGSYVLRLIPGWPGGLPLMPNGGDPVWRLKSIRAGGRDLPLVPTEVGGTITLGTSDITDVVITMTASR
jgi:hypothetical protein